MNVMADVSPFMLIVHFFGYGSVLFRLDPHNANFMLVIWGWAMLNNLPTKLDDCIYVICCVYFKIKKILSQVKAILPPYKQFFVRTTLTKHTRIKPKGTFAINGKW